MRNVSTAFMDHLHEEAIALLYAAHDWALKADTIARRGDPAERLPVIMASLGLTTLVIDSVAWTLSRKALVAGELSETEAASDEWAPMQLAGDTFATAPLPAKLTELIKKVESFHRRISLLHAGVQ